jgi:hypothetical protein
MEILKQYEEFKPKVIEPQIEVKDNVRPRIKRPKQA